jgi:protein SCO1/2
MRSWAAVTLILLAMACDRPERAASSGSADGYHGVRPTPPFPKPDFTLTATDGRPYQFRSATDGYITLLFFGYTHCPDVCPTHMADIAAVLHELDPAVAKQVKVVFVTTDPERDTSERLRQWLGQLDTNFVGLRGPMDTVNRVLAHLRLQAVRPHGPDSTHQPGSAHGRDSSYTVDHSAMVLAYTRDNLAHFVYPFGMRREDWANDLPRLVKERGAPS